MSSLEEVAKQVAADINAGRLGQAESALRQILSRDPSHVGAMELMGVLALRQGRLNDAVTWAQRAAAADPSSADLHYNLGVILATAGQAREAAQAYERAIRLQSDMSPAHNNLGNIYRSEGRLTEATESFQRALAIRPDYALALSNLALVLLEMGESDSAMNYLRRALAAKPDFATAHSNLLLAMNSHDEMDRRAMLEAHRQFGHQQADPVAGAARAPRPRIRQTGERLRVGYISADFRSHSVAFFIDKVLANHDRSQFEVFCYSSVSRPDAMTQRLRGFAEHWREIAHEPDDRAAEMIRQDRLDLLVELGGHTEGNRLLVMARRPAPIQATYLGYPNTTGLQQIDYLITDAQLAPPGTDAFYTEKVIRLPGSFFCYFGPELGVPVAPPPAARNSFVTFAVLTNWVKVRPRMIELWASLLHAVPNAQLILKAKSLNDSKLAQRIRDEFSTRGIDPARVDVQSWTDFLPYMRLMSEIDIGLDTFPFNGHTTTCHQLWMGVPVVTLAGQTQASLMGKSILTSLDLPDLVADSAEEYLRITTELAQDINRLTELRASMRARWNASGLLDGVRFTRELEAAYTEMCKSP